jgi:choice-of-anchor A domain-containing protein
MSGRNVIIAICLLAGAAASRGDSINLGAAGNFGILGLNNGTVTINSATSITGDVGYSNGVVSNTNQKVDSFNGTVYVHSGATFNYTPATFNPSGGFVIGGAADGLLNQANSDALSASSTYFGLGVTQTLGAINDTSVLVNSTGAVNVISISSINLNSDHFTINSRAGFNDLFIFNVTGSFDWSQSIADGTALPGNILWNFPNASSINVNKQATVFEGTILAPTGSVIYHNPATFTGSIVALNIDLHSDFNMSQPPVPADSSTPLPTAALGGLALFALAMAQRGWRGRLTGLAAQ